MPSPSISVELSREEAKALCGGIACPDLPAAKAKLRAALDSTQPECFTREEIEKRLFGEEAVALDAAEDALDRGEWSRISGWAHVAKAAVKDAFSAAFPDSRGEQ